MDKQELEMALIAKSKELRNAIDSYTKPESDVAELDKRCASLNDEIVVLKKQLAECDAPKDEPKQERSVFGKIADAMMQKRSVTVNGTGVVKTIKEIYKKVQDDNSILADVSYFFGRDSQTRIPAWVANATAAFVAEGGSATTQTGTLAATNIDPAQVLASIPVSQQTLDLSGADLEADLPEIFANAFGDLMATGMCTGDGTTNKMIGIFADTTATVNTTAATAFKISDLVKLATDVKGKKISDPTIWMSSFVYSKFVADSTTGEDVNIYKEDLIRNKTIEGVKVVITPYAPTAIAAGSIIAVAGSPKNYAIGVAGEISIKAKETAGSTLVTFDAFNYFNGKPIISSDFIQLKVHA